MKKQYIYSNDKEFLSKIDMLQIREQWVKITLLEYSTEEPLKDIEGKIIDGNLNKAGDSSVRRTCNLSCVIDLLKYDSDKIKHDSFISKKVYLELGITNNTDDYINEKIIWFPQGIFFITGFSISSSAGGSISINLQFKDKMAQLDGTVGGILPATTRFDTTTIIDDNNIVYTNKTSVYDIIMETVNHFGNEDISNIIIDDIPSKIKRIVKWMGDESLWIYPIVNNNNVSYNVCLTSDLDEQTTAHTPVYHGNKIVGAKEYKTNEDIGYIYEDFVYDSELTFNAGSKVTDVLDKIKNWLGNYEYFYDEYGQFHFQEIKNYLNSSQSAEIWDKIEDTDDSDYVYEYTSGKSVYTFDDNINLISITNTPVYENIKNDFIVEGTFTRDSIKSACRYHLVIDDKPTISINGYDNVLVYTDPSTKMITITNPIIVSPTLSDNNWTWLLPESGAKNKIYGLLDEPQQIVFKVPLKDIDAFETYYNEAVNEEMILIAEENVPTEQEDIIKTAITANLFNILETNMREANNNLSSSNKYYDIIFTLIRQIRRYNITKQNPTNIIQEYYSNLYTKFESDILIYGELQKTKISQDGELLKLLYDSYNNIGVNPSDNYAEYINNSYWPSINTSLPQLWDNFDIIEATYSWLRGQRITRCKNYINDLKIKQKQLKILIESYTQIINNYNAYINLLRRNNNDDDIPLINSYIDIIQTQINNYKTQLQTSDKRLEILNALLTALGDSDSLVGDVYYNVDIKLSARVTSFWYYNNNSEQDNYGWNKINWYKYYHNSTDPTSYYPDGLGSMVYINFENIDPEQINLNNGEYLSMNSHSDWYQNFYINYAIDNDLPTVNNDSYIPLDWRTELLLQGLRAEENGTDTGPYYQELKANWPQIYDFQNEQLLPSSINYINYFVGDTCVLLGSDYSFGETNDLYTDSNGNIKFKESNDSIEIKNYTLNYNNSNYTYFFDIIDSSSPMWGEYSVKNIGRRTNVNINNSVNCIFAPSIPNYAFLNVSNLTTKQRAEAYAELQNISEEIIQITDTYFNNFATGGLKRSAYEQIKYDLQQYTSYQNTLSITSIPCLYLEPNVRVKINEHTTNTFGDYIVKSISIPLGGDTMSLNLSKVMEKI